MSVTWKGRPFVQTLHFVDGKVVFIKVQTKIRRTPGYTCESIEKSPVTEASHKYFESAVNQIVLVDR